MKRFVMDMLRVLRMPCREHTALLSRQLDGPLPRGEHVGLRLHLVYCAGCRRFRDQIRTLRALSRALGEQTKTGEGLPDAVRDRLIARAAQEPGKN